MARNCFVLFVSFKAHRSVRTISCLCVCVCMKIVYIFLIVYLECLSLSEIGTIVPRDLGLRHPAEPLM